MTARICGHCSLRNRSRSSGQQQPPGAFADVHAAAAAFLDQAFVDQLLITLQHRQRIEPVIGGNRPHGGQWVTLLERTLENEGDHSIAQLAIDGLIVVPIRVHSSLDVLLQLYSTLV